MNIKHAVIIGATGLIGHHLLNRLLENDSVENVTVLVRRPFPIKHPKLVVKLIEFGNRESLKLAMEGGHALFCCIGTTRAKVKGDQEAYRNIDYRIPVNAAQIAKELDYASFHVVSAIGANAGSGNFYVRLKGEMERDVQTSGLAEIHIYRPSLLLGNRKEFRLGERIAQAVMPVVSFLIPDKYKPIQGTAVADAMLWYAMNPGSGHHIHEYRDMQKSKEKNT